MYAAECAAAGHDEAAVIAATRDAIPRTRTFGMVGSLDYAVRGGRVPRWVKRVADALRLVPVLHADREGRVTLGGVLFGRNDATAKFARFVRRRMRADRSYRVLVGHANCEADGQWLLEMLRAPNVEYARLIPLGTALGAHGGPGMLVAAFQDYEAPRRGAGPMKFETLAIHAGRQIDPATGALRDPLHLSTTFERDADGEYPRGYHYTRSGNPNRASLERAVAALERGHEAVAFGSGSAATLAVFNLAAPGGRIVCGADCYHGTAKQLREIVPGWGVEVEFVDTTNLAAVEAALDRGRTSLLWFETPTNPMLQVSDIAALVELAHARGALVGCDNTFASPVLQRPLTLGADLVMHSTTKYLGGHSDVLGGIVVTREPGRGLDGLRHFQSIGGGVPSPFDCWLVLRSLATLPLRVRQQAANALAVAHFLHADRRRVQAVHYAGLPDHPGHASRCDRWTAGSARCCRWRSPAARSLRSRWRRA